VYVYSFFCDTCFGSVRTIFTDIWIPLGTLYLNIGLFSFPCGSSTADRGPKSKLGTHLLLLYHSLLNRDCNLVFSALLPSVFSQGQDVRL
jgi:hypothetical protein